ncbi:alpha/beta fold hydrolase [Chitinibacter sp. GC72]|uniref:alpha/beta fold hydrolase n=1 Tax=Chitinibacter sp. GC72 TaxID=1526917 RepID=UPI0012F85A1D|nr:alpha/beta hydrolase [Chitinibacter sp. GC72]
MSTWILLRGLMRETRHWGDFPQQLQTRFPDDQVICLEWPGNGLLYRQKSLNSIKEMAGYCKQSLIQQGASQPYHVIAISMGAMAALEWVRLRPADVASCTLINTSLAAFNPAHQRLRAHNWHRLLALALLGPIERERVIFDLCSNQRDTAALRAWQQYAKECPVYFTNVLRQLWAASQYRGDRYPPPIPTLLLNSTQDRLVDPACSASIALAWQCPLKTHPYAGHDLPLDAPDWVLDQLTVWLAQKN